MGNSSSKGAKGDLPKFTRTDTSTSQRSGRSIRSKRLYKSKDKDLDDAASFKTATSEVSKKFPHSPLLSRRGSSAAVDGKHEALDSTELGGNNLTLNVNTDTEPLSLGLPPSMVQLEPKTPILIRRDSNANSIANGTAGTGSVGVVGTPSAPRPYSRHNSFNDHGAISPNISRTTSRTNSETVSIRSDLDGVSLKLAPGTPGTSTVLPLLSKVNSKIGSSAGVVIDVEDLIQRLLDAGYSGKRTKNVCLKNSEIQVVCSTARELFLSQPPLLELSPPVKIVGDVHGQYNDLIRMFSKCGFPPAANYLFLGDYVDRGKQSLETILLLLCYKIKYPDNFFLLRGNHECANVTRVYGFYDECKRRCNIKTWKIFIDTFNTLPIAAIVAGKIFCVHGGLSPTLHSMDEIRNIQRPTDVPDFGLLNDLLWSDPADTPNEWEDNERGVSYCFSKVAINKFLTKFNFDLVCRAHMVVEDGYEFFNDRSLVTVFSAPNYCGEFDNWGAVMSVSEDLLCSFELLDPLDPIALKQYMKKGRVERKIARE